MGIWGRRGGEGAMRKRFEGESLEAMVAAMDIVLGVINWSR